jgi:tetratricopeptide (TPR) repeat protein
MIKRVATVLAVFLAASSVRAEECPRDAPEDSGLRRMLAKKWFSKGETEAKAGNDVAAMKDYQCSLMFVPHGFTAYNIGQLAEKTGDLEVAIASFGQYLLLVPDAKDAKEIGERVETLKDRLAKVRDSDKGLGGSGNEPPLEHLMEKTQEESFPDAAMVPESPTSESGVSSATGQRQRNYRRIGWITAGGGAVLVLGGVLSNVLARGQMDTCRSEYKQGHQSAAESACSNATPLAYLSYGLIGVGAAAVVTGAVLMFVRPSASEPDDVAVNVLPEGGLSLRWSGRF